MPKVAALHFTPDADANALLAKEPLAVLVGMLLDQQVTMEKAFRGPLDIKTRMGGTLDAAEIAAMDQDAFVTMFCERPALHRFPGSMGKRTHELCRYLVEHYDGKAEKVWKGVKTGDELLKRMKALPGFGEDKARIFVGILGKRLGVRPEGWEVVAADWASIADVDSFERITEIRDAKRAMKAAKKSVKDVKAPKS